MIYLRNDILPMLRGNLDNLNTNGYFVYYTLEKDAGAVNKFLSNDIHERIMKNTVIRVHKNYSVSDIFVSVFYSNESRLIVIAIIQK